VTLARFCAPCGQPTAPFHEHGHARARCGACGWIDYANPKPAVGAVLVRDGKVLLSRRAREPHAGLWDLPGGFLESGEHPEAGIVRELREETGLAARVVSLVHVGVGDYFGHGTVNLVYLCEAEGEPRAMDDSADLRWVDPRALPRMAFPHEQQAVVRWLASLLPG
jgi:mutator protein MutT